MSDIKRFINNGNYYYFGKNIPVHISGISLNKSSISLTSVGQTSQLTATITPTGYVDSGAINRSSSDTSIATVSNTGLVTCVTPGTCTITATTVVGGHSATCEVRPVQDVELYYDLKGGSDAGLVAAGFTGTYTNGSMAWYSNGLGQTGTSNDRNTFVYVNGIDLSQAKKITFWSNGYWKNASWSNGKSIVLCTNWSSGTVTHPRWSGSLGMANNSGYQGSGMYLSNSSGTNVISQSTQANKTTGDTKQTLTIDLVNKTASYVLTGANSASWNATLTDEYVTWTRAMTTFVFGWGRGYSSENDERLKEVYIKIEK